MQIDFASAGGTTGELTYQVDTNTLPETQAKEILRLVESTDVFALQQNDLNSGLTVGRTDVITYRLTLSDGDRQTTLWMNDLTAPASLRPLLEFLRERALTRKSL